MAAVAQVMISWHVSHQQRVLHQDPGVALRHRARGLVRHRMGHLRCRWGVADDRQPQRGDRHAAVRPRVQVLEKCLERLTHVVGGEGPRQIDDQAHRVDLHRAGRRRVGQRGHRVAARAVAFGQVVGHPLQRDEERARHARCGRHPVREDHGVLLAGACAGAVQPVGQVDLADMREIPQVSGGRRDLVERGDRQIDHRARILGRLAVLEQAQQPGAVGQRGVGEGPESGEPSTPVR